MLPILIWVRRTACLLKEGLIHFYNNSKKKRQNSYVFLIFTEYQKNILEKVNYLRSRL